MQTNTTTQDVKSDLETALGRLRTLRDEARVRVHLAGLDIRDAWSKLEPKIEDAEREAGQRATDALVKTVQTLTRAVDEMLAKL